MVGGAALETSAVVGAAGIGGGDIRPGQGEHGTSAVSTEQKAGVVRGILLLAPVVAFTAQLHLLLGVGKGPGVNDGGVGILDDDMLLVPDLPVFAVDALADILFLPQGADVEVVCQQPGQSGSIPNGAAADFCGNSGGFLLGKLIGTGGGHAIVRQVVGNLFVPPAIVVQPEDFPHHLGGRWVDFIGHGFGVDDPIAIGHGTDPFAVLLAALDDLFDLPGGVRNRHFVHQELELNQHPVVLGGIVNAVTNGNNPDTRIPQGFQLQQSQAVSSGKPGEVLDHQNGALPGHHAAPHFLVAFPLGEGVAGAIPVFKQGQVGIREGGTHEIGDDFLLVFNTGVFPAVLIQVNGDSCVAKYFQCCSLPICIYIITLYLVFSENASVIS